LWIARGREVRQKRRDVVNAQEVEECLERHGFTVVEMAELSVRRQVAIVRSAEVLGGPHGSGLVHSILLKPRSTVIECFSALYVNPCVIGTCTSLRHRYRQIVSRNTPSDAHPYGVHLEIDCDHLWQVLQELGPTQPSSPAFPSARGPNPLSRQAYDAALSAHDANVGSALARIERMLGAEHDQDVLKRLRTV
jgi:hypothetical protein